MFQTESKFLFPPLSGMPRMDNSLLLIVSIIVRRTTSGSRVTMSWSLLFLSLQILWTYIAKLSFQMVERRSLSLVEWTMRTTLSDQGSKSKGMPHFTDKASQIFMVKGLLKKRWSWVSNWESQRRHLREEVSMCNLSWVSNRPLIASQRINPALGTALGNETKECH